MNVPFTKEQFFAVMVEYNEAVWPMPLVLGLLALAAVGLIFSRRPWSGRVVSAVLALLWVWTGVAYHLRYFTLINQAAFLFGVVSILGAVAFLWAGVIKNRLAFTSGSLWRRVVGAVLLAYALAVYPLLSSLLGHGYPAMPTFGLPCPTTIFTVGVLCFLAVPFPRYIVVVPVLWSVVGTQAAFLFGVYQDLGLVVAGLVGVLLFIFGKGEGRSA